jgi:hypothetical protein
MVPEADDASLDRRPDGHRRNLQAKSSGSDRDGTEAFLDQNDDAGLVGHPLLASFAIRSLGKPGS